MGLSTRGRFHLEQRYAQTRSGSYLRTQSGGHTVWQGNAPRILNQHPIGSLELRQYRASDAQKPRSTAFDFQSHNPQ